MDSADRFYYFAYVRLYMNALEKSIKIITGVIIIVMIVLAINAQTNHKKHIETFSD